MPLALIRMITLYIDVITDTRYKLLSIFRSIFASFNSDIQPNFTFFLEITGTGSNSWTNL